MLRLRDELRSLFKKFALAGPEVISPSIAETRLALVDRAIDTPSPTSKEYMNGALVEPSKKGLHAYDRMMGELESATIKFMKVLDGQVTDAQEAREKDRVLQERTQKRLQKKVDDAAKAISSGRQAGSFVV